MSEQRRSILWQLSCYTPPPMLNVEQAEEAAHRIVDDTVSIPHPPRNESAIYWCDILYPKKLWEAYRNVRELGGYASEQACDNMLAVFMAEANKKAYIDDYQKSVTPNIMRLMMFRVLVASFGQDEIPGGNLPISYRPIALQMLGLGEAPRYNVAVGMMEEASRNASHEDLILGRVGYLMIWQNRCHPNRIIPPSMRLSEG